MTKPVYLLHDEVHVIIGNREADEYHPEAVHLVVDWLVTDHQ